MGVPSEKVNEWLDFLPPEARVAVETDGDWEWKPPCATDGAGWAESCDCPAQWHLRWYEQGYEVDASILTVVIWSVDQDGDWSRDDSMAVDDEDFDAWLARNVGELAEAERQRGWREYARWVYLTGDDVLGEYGAGGPRQETWAIQLQWTHPAGLIAIAGRRTGPDLMETWVVPADFPQAVRSSLNMPPDSLLVEPGVFPTWESFYVEYRQRDIPRDQRPIEIVTIEVAVPLPDEERRALVKQAALRHVVDDSSAS